MDVLTSKNRMSANTFLSLYFSNYVNTGLFPNVTQERRNTPLVVHNDHALKEFIKGEERCLKFINQDPTFLQDLHIPSTFKNVSHTTTSLKELAHINLPTCISNEHISKENNSSSHTQSVQPTLGFTPANVH